MTFTQITLGSSPAVLSPSDVLREKWDCIWVHFAARTEPEPLRSQALQWLDWKFKGALTEFLVRGGMQRGQTTFIATLKKIPVPYLALEPAESSGWAAFRENCAGLKIKTLLVLSEESKAHRELKTQLSRTSKLEFPEQVTWALEQEDA